MIATAAKWEYLTRDSQLLEKVSLYIFDQLHTMHDLQAQQAGTKTAAMGTAYEVLITRVKLHQAELLEAKDKTAPRLVCLSLPLATAKDVSDWLGIDFERACFNFAPNVRARCTQLGPLQVHVQAFDSLSRRARLSQMLKPTFAQIRACLLGDNSSAQVMVFVHKVVEAERQVHELLNLAIGDETDDMLHGAGHEQTFAAIKGSLVDENLAQSLELGAAWLHATMSAADRNKVLQMYSEGAIKLMVCTFDQAESLSTLSADLVVVQDPQ